MNTIKLAGLSALYCAGTYTLYCRFVPGNSLLSVNSPLVTFPCGTPSRRTRSVCCAAATERERTLTTSAIIGSLGVMTCLLRKNCVLRSAYLLKSHSDDL